MTYVATRKKSWTMTSNSRGVRVIELWRPPRPLFPVDCVMSVGDLPWTSYSMIKEDAEQWRASHVGERNDEKLALVSLRANPRGRVTFELGKTTWAEIRPANLRRERGLTSAEIDSAVGDFAQTRRWPAPNLCAVHVAVRTSDNSLVLTRRAADLAFYPGSWSASFEEQLDPEDLLSGSAPHNAARGLREEFGLAMGEARVEDFAILALIVEWPNGNVGWVMAGDLDLTFGEVAERRKYVPPSMAEWSDLRPANPATGTVTELRQSLSPVKGHPIGSVHPTVAIRLALASAYWAAGRR